MMKTKMKRSERLGEVLTVALRGMSDPQAAKRATERGAQISHTPINQMRGGWYGRPETVRTLARGISDLLLRDFGDEIERTCGDRSQRSAEEWLVSVASNRRPARSVELTYEPDPATAFPEGSDGLEGLPPEEVEEAKRIWRAMIREKRRKLGLTME